MLRWQTIIGHEWAVQLLAGAIDQGRVGHAYLITGPEHIGKTTLARTFAQALNCTAEPGARPCGTCRTCQLIARDHHPDVRLIVPEISARGKASIKIADIRQLQQDLTLSAYEARTKVAILTHFDSANLNAANAFLKTLEEPPNNVVLLLTANDGDSLLETIRSRCRTLALRPLPVALIEESLMTRWRIAPDEAELLAHLADGRLGWAVLAGQDATLHSERIDQLQALQSALDSRRVGRFNLADRLARKPETLPALLRTWLSWWRDAVLLAYDDQATITNIDHADRLRDWVRAATDDALLHSLKQTDTALWQLEHNANTRLVLENLLLAYPIR